MARYQGLIKRILLSPDLPEVRRSLPLTELAGDQRVLIENHHCIMQYTKSCICVKVSFGSIRIKGRHLSIARMTSVQLVICGSIESIEIVRTCVRK